MSTTDTELKARHRTMWASGDYPGMVETFLLPLGPRLVEACGIEAGMRVLDVAAGTGNASIPAAQAGADVVASDLTPELLEAGRARAEAEGLELEWVEADAENLPFDDESFDVVMSSIGAMFAPRHEAVAEQLVRVCKPGGTIGLLSWTPEGMIGALFRTMGPFAPAAGGAAAAALGLGGAPAGALRRPRRLANTRARHARDHGVPGARRLREPLQVEVRPDDRHPGQRAQERPGGGVRGGALRVRSGVEPRRRRTGALRDGVPDLGRHTALAATGARVAARLRQC
jgi:SAM-dependent methyltransferase